MLGLKAHCYGFRGSLVRGLLSDFISVKLEGLEFRVEDLV